MKTKGQLGAAQDSLALETKMLIRKSIFSGASHLWHDSMETEGERMLVLGAETPAESG